MHTCIHTHTHTHTHKYIYTNIYIYIYIYIYINTYIYIYIHTFTYRRFCVCACVCVYTSIHMHEHFYVHNLTAKSRNLEWFEMGFLMKEVRTPNRTFWRMFWNHCLPQIWLIVRITIYLKKPSTCGRLAMRTQREIQKKKDL